MADEGGIDNPGLVHEDSLASMGSAGNASDDSYVTVAIIDGDKTYPVQRKGSNQTRTEQMEEMSIGEDSAPLPSTETKPATSFGGVGAGIVFFYSIIGNFIKKHYTFFKAALTVILVGLYMAYFIGAIYYSVSEGAPVDFCNGVELLYILTGAVFLGVLYFKIVKPYFGRTIYKTVLKPISRLFNKVWEIRFVPSIFFCAILAGLVTFLVIDSLEQLERLRSAFGLVVIILLGWIFSAHPGHVRWRHVFWGLALQFIFGLLLLRWDVGRDIFQCLGDKVSAFLSYTVAGSGFVYGWLATGQPLTVSLEPNPYNQTVTILPNPLKDIFAFGVLSVIFFFSFFINILYYFGVMQFIVMKLGWLLQISIGTTAAESMNAAANIFLGQTEAPLLIKPYISAMTKSELHAVMTGGFATIAGSVLAAYISFGIDASNLIAASVMAAPAALAFSKLFYPETEESKTKTGDIVLEKGKEANALDAAAQGASNAVFLVMNIVANLIAFLAFVAFLNGIISWFGGLVGAPYITFEWIIAQIFIPVAWLLGVHWSECEMVGQLLAIKTIVNEFAAFSRLADLKEKGLISPRGESIVTYALCGFANPGSIGSQIAALSTMSPSRQPDLASIAFRAFVAGATASLLNACIAGTLITAPGPVTPIVNGTSYLY